MCGIVGIINLDLRPIDFGVLKKMSDAQNHRGPDDQGFAGFSFAKKCSSPFNLQNGSLNSHFSGGIGFNRLSILDLSMNGHQPMISADGNVVIAYNGETYNAFQFKNELERKGYTFKSQTDTEVILNLYRAYGIKKMLELINGMFAFCIVDLKLGKTFLVRDHVGIKPMYWYKKGETLLFASEIKAFLSHPGFVSEINENCIDEYLFYKYNAHDRTLFKNVRQVAPAHYLEIDGESEKLVKYWAPQLSNNVFLSKRDAVDGLEDVLKSSVKAQLISDVKVGCQLSGGVDSSMVTTYARKFFDANMDTFSILVQSLELSEEKYIDQVIEKTNPAAHKYSLTPHYFAENLLAAAWHIDVPLPIPQAIGIKQLAKGASDYVTVLLSGEGSDELMAGYKQFYYLAYKYRNPKLISLLTKIPAKGEKIRKQFLPDSNVDDYFIKYRAALNLPDFRNFRPGRDFEEMFEQRKQLFPKHDDVLKSVRVYDMKGWLVSLLNIQDKMTMAHSIENRVPIMDKRVIDFVFSLPSDYFLRGSRNPFNYNSPNRYTKILLKKLTARYYNNDFVYRTKMGFNQPLRAYFAEPGMKEIVNDVILPGFKNRGLLDYKKLTQMWEDSQKNFDNSNMNFLWTCLTFELWAQLFIDRKLIA